MKAWKINLKRQDIFYKTRRNITLLSTSIVFLCLFVFVAIFQTIYISKTYNEIDENIVKQKILLEKELLKKSIIDHPNIGYSKENKPNAIGKLKTNAFVIVYEDGVPITINHNLYFDIFNTDGYNIPEKDKIVDVKINDYNFRGIRFGEDSTEFEILMNIDAQLNSIKSIKTSIYISLVALLIFAIVCSKILSYKVIVPVKEAYNKQVFFVQDASHEMRTPLAIIKGKLELLARSIGSKDESSFEDISKIMSEIRGLEKLNNDLLLLSRADIYSNINITQFYLDELIEDVGEFYTDLSELQNKNFSVINNTKNILVKWDYEKVKRCIVILLENAFKYTLDDGNIQLVVKDDNKNVVINVIDNGIGIKKEDEDRIFDRFYRSNDIRATNIGGSGIGLSLLRSIAKNLNIKVDVNSIYNQGSEFALIIPKNKG